MLKKRILCGFIKGMKALYARELTEEERAVVARGLRASSAFTVRRSQILLMSSEERLKAAQIAERLRCSDQTIRRTLHAFEQEGVACLEAKPRARLDEQRAFDGEARERLKELVRRSPREFGYEASLWTLGTLAEVSLAEGLTGWLVSLQTMSRTLHEAGINWQRAKHWITSPDEHYEAKKSAATG